MKTPDPVSVLDFFHAAPIKDAERVLEMARTLVQARKKRPSVKVMPAVRTAIDAGDNGESLPIVQKAEAVLESIGTPMSGPALTEAINERFGSSHTRDSVVGGLARSAGNGGPLSRAAKGLYGLRKWEEGRPAD